MEKWYEYGTTEDYMKAWADGIPENKSGKKGLDALLEDGAWEDPSRKPFYQPYETELSADELKGTSTDDNGIITKLSHHTRSHSLNLVFREVHAISPPCLSTGTH